MSVLITSGGVVTLGGGVPLSVGWIYWDHNGENVTGFILSVDGVELNLGALSPVFGTTYRTAWPAGTSVGTHEVVVYAVNGAERTPSLITVLSYA